MKTQRNKKGFTLIEMLVVIAIIAILVAIIVPTVTVSLKKANAATDAANLRSVLGEANVIVFNGEKHEAITQIEIENIHSKSCPDADMYVVYTLPGFIGVFFVDGTNYYSLDYFSELAFSGSTEITTADPRTYDPMFTEANGAEWYKVSGAGG